MDEREIILVDYHENDFTSTGPWIINNETYNFVEDYMDGSCDGECHNVIILREKDNKYFKFTWNYYHENYYFQDKFVEVFPTIITKTIYK